MPQFEKPGVESTLKSLDTEEFIDIHFYRPLGYRWALLFRKMGVSPNSVTLVAIVLGVTAGVCFYFQNIYINIMGMLLLVWANTYDSTDGQLARMTGKMSPLGRMLDGLCGDLWFITIYAAICMRLFPEWNMWIWVLGALAGYCHTRQAAMADYYRNLHLLFLKGKAGSEWSNSATLREEYKQVSWRKNFFLKFADRVYLGYTSGQEKRTPNLQRMMSAIRTQYNGEAPGWFREAFRKESLPLMKYTNILSFNTRAIALFTAISIGMPWLYFVFELTVLNAIQVYMVVKHEHFSLIFAGKLES
ncbi:hypothetical protein FACS1894181_10640 [Bacteroidia bacterium]|nr:hypothetical protein FACS1894181_10640 [Bacteroidia bacterium]